MAYNMFSGWNLSKCNPMNRVHVTKTLLSYKSSAAMVRYILVRGTRCTMKMNTNFLLSVHIHDQNLHQRNIPLYGTGYNGGMNLDK